jgi:hypothetical protein
MRIPQKAGKTRCPMAKTIVDMKPTVRACRDAPQRPPDLSHSDALTETAAEINSQT